MRGTGRRRRCRCPLHGLGRYIAKLPSRNIAIFIGEYLRILKSADCRLASGLSTPHASPGQTQLLFSHVHPAPQVVLLRHSTQVVPLKQYGVVPPHTSSPQLPSQSDRSNTRNHWADRPLTVARFHRNPLRACSVDAFGYTDLDVPVPALTQRRPSPHKYSSSQNRTIPTG